MDYLKPVVATGATSEKGRDMWFGIVYLGVLGLTLLAVFEVATSRLHHR